jgi:hypothetical protein
MVLPDPDGPISARRSFALRRVALRICSAILFFL